MSAVDVMKELKEIQENPDLLLQLESELDVVLKEIIKIERKHLYGLNSTTSGPRKSAILELLDEKLKSKEF